MEFFRRHASFIQKHVHSIQCCRWSSRVELCDGCGLMVWFVCVCCVCALCSLRGTLWNWNRKTCVQSNTSIDIENSMKSLHLQAKSQTATDIRTKRNVNILYRGWNVYGACSWEFVNENEKKCVSCLSRGVVGLKEIHSEFRRRTQHEIKNHQARPTWLNHTENVYSNVISIITWRHICVANLFQFNTPQKPLFHENISNVVRYKFNTTISSFW